MIRVLKYIKSGVPIYISFEEYLEEYCKEIPEGWNDMSKRIDKVFNFQTEADYKILGSELQVENFDISKIGSSYSHLKKEYPNFDEDILRFISFLLGTSYFSKIGNPTIDQWLNANDINHPFKEKGNEGFSFTDALQYVSGQNAIRKLLLSTLHWISSQGGY